MRTAKAVVASTMEMAATMMTMAATMTMAAAMPSSVASATLAERHARQQGRQNKNGNSNGWFGHGTSLCHSCVVFGTTMTPMGTESSTRGAPGHQSANEARSDRGQPDRRVKAPRPPAISFPD